MNCKMPFVRGSQAFGCGQCLPCRINRKRLWKHRLVLESYCHPWSAFITLTYDEKNLPEGGTLVPKDLQDWLKRIRRRMSPVKLRFYAVGEYGDEKKRPHYHVALFNFPSCYFPTIVGHSVRSCGSCEPCRIVKETWGKGLVDVGSLTSESANYISGYVTKKMTAKKNQFQKQYLGDLHPEFARMSLRPGIGAPAMSQIAKDMAGLLVHGDVPSQLRHGATLLPLGRYLKQKLRGEYGLKDTSTPKEVLQEAKKKMLKLFEDLGLSPQAQKRLDREQKRDIIREFNKGKIASIEARHNIFSKKGKI